MALLPSVLKLLTAVWDMPVRQWFPLHFVRKIIVYAFDPSKGTIAIWLILLPLFLTPPWNQENNLVQSVKLMIPQWN